MTEFIDILMMVLPAKDATLEDVKRKWAESKLTTKIADLIEKEAGCLVTSILVTEKTSGDTIK